MSLNAEALRLMREKGLSLDDVVEIATAMEKRADRTGAERQQRYRERHNVTPSRNAVTPPNDIYSNPPNSSSKATPSSMKRGKADADFVCPDGVAETHWRDFLANRKRKRLPSTATAYAGVLREIAKYTDDEWPPGRIVQHAAEKGWGGIYDPRGQANGNTAKSNLRGSRPDPAVDLWRAAQAELAAEGADQDQIPDSGTRPALPSYLTG